MVVTILALTGIIYVSLVLADKYQKSLLSTVVESTNYHVSEISFPAITLCNNHRVDYEKFDAAMERFLPNATEETRNFFLRFLNALEVLDFGSFDELEDLKEHAVNNSSLKNLKLVEVAQFVRSFYNSQVAVPLVFLFQLSHSCESLFIRCWWRNNYLNCCEIFTEQKSEYGFCYSFNSASSAASPAVNVS